MTGTNRLAGAVVADGLVLLSIDLDHGVEHLSNGVSPVVEDAFVEARYGGCRHCISTRHMHGVCNVKRSISSRWAATARTRASVPAIHALINH